MSIEVRHVSKSFGRFAALRDVSLAVEGGELVALLGPSGCGKTTLLRIIAGLDHADPGSGRILLDGRDVTRQGAAARGVGFVFQHYALFRHMTIFDNVAFGLTVRPRRQRPGPAEVRERVMRLLELVQIDFLAGRFPAELSGGQRQRVALARALAVEPAVLLLDEPFGSLDAKVRRELRRWLRRLHDEIRVTSLFVTHDQEEALEVADRIVLMNEGRVSQVGRPSDVYDHPSGAFVYHFLGHANIFDASVESGTLHVGPLALRLAAGGLADAEKAAACARPYEIEVHAEPADDRLRLTLAHVLAVGPVVRLELERGDGRDPVEAELDRARFESLGLAPGDGAWISFRRLRVFAPGAPEGVSVTPTPAPPG